MFDLSDIVSDLATESVNVTRYAPASPRFVLGVAQAPTPSTFSALASVQPASGQDLLRLAEGFRTRDVRALFTATELRAASTTTGAPADMVALAEGNFEIQHVEPWQRAGGFYKCLASRIEP